MVRGPCSTHAFGVLGFALLSGATIWPLLPSLLALCSITSLPALPSYRKSRFRASLSCALAPLRQAASGLRPAAWLLAAVPRPRGPPPLPRRITWAAACRLCLNQKSATKKYSKALGAEVRRFERRREGGKRLESARSQAEKPEEARVKALNYSAFCQLYARHPRNVGTASGPSDRRMPGEGRLVVRPRVGRGHQPHSARLVIVKSPPGVETPPSFNES